MQKFTSIPEEFIDVIQQINFKNANIVGNIKTSGQKIEDFYKRQNHTRRKEEEEYFQLRDATIRNENQYLKQSLIS